MRFAHRVQFGRVQNGGAKFGPVKLVGLGYCNSVGRRQERGRQLWQGDRATGGGRLVIEIKRRGRGGDGGHGEQRHRRILPRLPHVHDDGRARRDRWTDN